MLGLTWKSNMSTCISDGPKLQPPYSPGLNECMHAMVRETYRALKAVRWSSPPTSLSLS